MSQFMGEDISTPRDRESLSDIDCFGFVIPNPICIGILPVHLRIRDLPDHNMIAEWKNYFVWYSHRALTVSSMSEHWSHIPVPE